jgi:Mce-associated membrane protein
MTRHNPRRPSSSRTPVSRPRRVAGQGSAASSEPSPAPVVEEVAQQLSRNPGDDDQESPSPGSPGFETGAERPPQPPVAVELGDREKPGLGALFDSRRATTVLIGLVAALVLVAGGLFAWDAAQGDDEVKPSTQPVVIGSDDAIAAADAAAKAAETIVATSYQDYDKQVDEATGLMTDAFGRKYRQTADDIKRDFVAAKTEIEARVVAQSVVHATRTEVQALVFLNQYVSKDGGDTTYTPYRALVTVVHTDRGWLVSNLDTK